MTPYRQELNRFANIIKQVAELSCILGL